MAVVDRRFLPVQSSWRWEVSLKQAERGARSAAETVNCLIRITYGENVLVFSCQLLKDFQLSEVGVLEFIDKNEAGPLAFTAEERRVMKHFVGTRDHVPEGAEVVVAKHFLDSRINPRNLLAPAQDFFFAQFSGVLGLRNARDWQLAAFQAAARIPHIVQVRPDFVLTAPHEIEKVIEEFCESYRRG